MKNSAIINLQKHYPHLMPGNLVDERFAEYIFLNQLSSLCAIHFPSDTSKEMLQVIADGYQSCSFFERNAIENEFLFPLLAQLHAHTLHKNISLLPQALRAVNNEILLETQKK